ncbi:hypothetical protein DSO57_1033708 [Entomophthora muscae]|uniref:Uncharacterized protein n=1 Tax=Entomophthora muscae TaxID=34485 RepID=A0ACC2TLS0_9FUNG|nr:hypothetical protein DSO57_1033708 [Entomophthora muscae]
MTVEQVKAIWVGGQVQVSFLVTRLKGLGVSGCLHVLSLTSIEAGLAAAGLVAGTVENVVVVESVKTLE